MSVYRSFLAITVLAAVLTGCGPNYRETTVKSGRVVKTLGLTRVTFSNAPPLLQYQYLTDSNIRDVQALRTEAEEIWPEFRTRVELDGYTGAAITAVGPRFSLLGLSSNISHGFTVSRNPNGSWTHNDWGRDYDAEELVQARSLLAELEDRDYPAAARLLHYPSSFSDEEKDTDIAEVASDMEVAADSLGPISEHSLNSIPTNSYQFILKTASEEYWLKHPVFDWLVYDVRFTKVGRGQLIIEFSIVEEDLVIRSIKYCLDPQMPDSMLILQTILRRVENLPPGAEAESEKRGLIYRYPAP